MIAVTAAGGVLYRKRAADWEVLLIYRNDVWDLPKGKLEDSESIEACARREVAEEVGIAPPNVECPLVQTNHTYQQNGSNFIKTTHWFRMKTEVDQDFTPEKAEGIEAVQWVAIADAEEKVGYENLREVLQAFKNSLK